MNSVLSYSFWTKTDIKQAPAPKQTEKQVIRSPHEELMAACSQSFTHMVQLLLEERILLTPPSHWSRLLAIPTGGHYTHMVQLLLEERVLLTPPSHWSRLLAIPTGGHFTHMVQLILEERVLLSALIKKKKNIFLIYKEIQKGAVACLKTVPICHFEHISCLLFLVCPSL